MENQPEKEKKFSSKIAVGIVLILVGIFIILQNFNILNLTNWWALFILIPASASFYSAWNNYQHAGRKLNKKAYGAIIGGLILTAITIVFLFNLDFGKMWPIFIVLAGIGILTEGFTRGN